MSAPTPDIAVAQKMIEELLDKLIKEAFRSFNGLIAKDFGRFMDKKPYRIQLSFGLEVQEQDKHLAEAYTNRLNKLLREEANDIAKKQHEEARKIKELNNENIKMQFNEGEPK